MKRLLPMILIMSLMGSMVLPAQASTPPSKPAATQPGKLYTEAEVLAAVDAALEKAIPLAVQAAVAQRDGELAAAKVIEADLRQAVADERGDARRARRWTTGVVIGGSALASAAFIAGAWIGLRLQGSAP